PQAIASYEQALAIADANGDRAGQGLVYARLGRLYERSQLWAQALAAYEQALGLQREVGDRANAGVALSRIGTVRLAQGDAEAALAPLREAIAIWEDLRPGLSDADKVALVRDPVADLRKFASGPRRARTG
ncbi:MAG: tetratricopeptide repeat protein, partial [Spirulinaceae cyanobacterium RM2_2_10]|nr:tetratricopeptide repeat protein [Spirulinaceae cyanobacterium RM2_2_10]